MKELEAESTVLTPVSPPYNNTQRQREKQTSFLKWKKKQKTITSKHTRNWFFFSFQICRTNNKLLETFVWHWRGVLDYHFYGNKTNNRKCDIKRSPAAGEWTLWRISWALSLFLWLSSLAWLSVNHLKGKHLSSCGDKSKTLSVILEAPYDSHLCAFHVYLSLEVTDVSVYRPLKSDQQQQ